METTENMRDTTLQNVLAQLKKTKILNNGHGKIEFRESEDDIRYTTMGSIDDVELKSLIELLKDTGLLFFIHCTAKNGEVELLIY